MNLYSALNSVLIVSFVTRFFGNFRWSNELFMLYKDHDSTGEKLYFPSLSVNRKYFISKSKDNVAMILVILNRMM